MTTWPTIRWLGNAHFQFSCEGYSFSVDPWVTNNPSCPVQLDDLRELDAVVVSHGHPGHFGRGDSVKLAQKTGIPYLAPRALTDYVVRERLLPPEQVRPITTQELVSLGPVWIAAFEIPHPPVAHEFEQQAPGRPNYGLVIDFDDVRILHVGDTTPDPVYERLRGEGQVHLALLPLWSKEMVWTEDEAVQSAADVISQLRPDFAFFHARYRPEVNSIPLLQKELELRKVSCCLLQAKPGDYIALSEAPHNPIAQRAELR